MLTSLYVAALARHSNVLSSKSIFVVTHMQTQKQNEYVATPNNDNRRFDDDIRALSSDFAAASHSGQLGTLDTAKDLHENARVLQFWTRLLLTLIMVSNLSRQFMVNEILLKKLAEKQTMNERGLNHVSLSELDRSPLQDCVDFRTSFARPSSVGSEYMLLAMCSDGCSKCTDDSSSILRPNAGSEFLEKIASLVEVRQEESEPWVPVETAPAPAHCLSTTATSLVNEGEACVTSREVQDYNGQFWGPDTSHYKGGEEEGSPINSFIGKDLCVREKLQTNEVVWKSIEAQGGSPIQLSKTQRITLQEELRRVAASSGQKSRLLERDTADVACAIVDVQIEERMDLHLRPTALTCRVESDNDVVRVFNEDASTGYSDPLGNNSYAVAFADRGSRSTQNQTLREDPLLCNGIVHIDSKQRCTHMVSVKGSKGVGSSQHLQDYKAEEKIEGNRKGKRKRCEEDALSNAIVATKMEDGLASSLFPSNCMGVCFGCKSSLTSSDKVDCSRNDCDRVYHLSCAVELPDVSWSCEGKVVCPQHVCYACGKSRGSRLWRCQNCSLATHENCIPCPEVTTLFHNRPGWAICWRHASNVDYKLRTPTWDCQDIFRYLPVPDTQQEFNLTPEFIKEVMENDREPPPYFFIRRNVFLVKKKRDDADDGVGCSCKSVQDVCGDDCECRGGRVQSMSCSKDCKCSDKCSNKPFRKDKRLKVVKTAHCGWGAFAAEAIKKDDFVIEYTGEVIDDAMCEKRLWEMKGRQSICNFYMCEIAKDFIIDATRKGNASRYLNHSCQPNCRLEKWRVDGETRVGVFAGRNIAVGEELNYDYKYVEFGPNVTCRCGAPNCRGAIGERFNSNRKSNNINLPSKWGCRRNRSSLA